MRLSEGTGKVDPMEIHRWFYAYIETFITGDPSFDRNIVLKRDHSSRVSREIQDLSEELGLPEEKSSIAGILGLLHDTGRFEQFKRYRTFDDRKSEDHAELGIQVLRDNRVLTGFSRDVQKILYAALGHHNKAMIPPSVEEDVLFFSRLLRDADKLDILKVFTDYYRKSNGVGNNSIELDLPDTPGVSKKLYRSLLQRDIGNFNHMENVNDFKLLKVGWIFDINFLPTLRKVVKRNYLKMIRDTLPEIREVEEIFSAVEEYINGVTSAGCTDLSGELLSRV